MVAIEQRLLAVRLLSLWPFVLSLHLASYAISVRTVRRPLGQIERKKKETELGTNFLFVIRTPNRGPESENAQFNSLRSYWLLIRAFSHSKAWKLTVPAYNLNKYMESAHPQNQKLELWSSTEKLRPEWSRLVRLRHEFLLAGPSLPEVPVLYSKALVDRTLLRRGGGLIQENQPGKKEEINENNLISSDKIVRRMNE